MADQDVNALLDQLGLDIGAMDLGAEPVPMQQAQRPTTSYAAPRAAPPGMAPPRANTGIDDIIGSFSANYQPTQAQRTNAEVDGLMAQIGVAPVQPQAGRGVCCAGPGAMRGGFSSGPGAGRGGFSSGPGAMRGMSSGPGAMRTGASGPGITPNPVGPNGQQMNFSGPPCGNCGQPIIGKVFSICGKQLHPECFKCHHCQRRMLETEQFMEEDGNIYCLDDYNELFGERCFRCKQPIDEECVEFLERLYHPEHFVCNECGTSLLTTEYAEDEGEPYCIPCKQARIKARAVKDEICAKCKKPIMGDYVVVNGQKMHADHFRCQGCGTNLEGSNIKEHAGKSYCIPCYNKLCKTLCAGCGKTIVGRSITALMLNWHPECLTCKECGETFAHGEFYEADGQPYCKFHYFKLFGKICPGCNQVVDDNSGLFVLGQTWHAQCFVCHGCQKKLEKDVYDYENKPLCKSCFGKLPKQIRKTIEEKMKAQQKMLKAEKKEAKKREKEEKKKK